MPSFSIQRFWFLPSGVFGQMPNSFYTLEHAYGPDNKPKIPAGKGIWKRYDSPKHGYDVFRCESIDGVNQEKHEYEIHIGNYNENSEGCILIGKSVGNRCNGDKMLCNSEKAFEEFMKSLDGVDSITIELID